ncbi:polysaccharide deacetylase family protein [Mesorhizobium sp. Z1-4]|uniref:polysaccharide deacetylase family protein n=1 Tax=Mesorhizobium sp. Z1-4 TaxID=2448478 RepID=UPI000FD96974|nr:polysaccharide deacetylase family protein [Mesorhizobium sp. Z1-4]
MRLFPALVAVAATLILAACTTKPKQAETPKLAFAAEKRADLSQPGNIMSFPGPRGTLRGRTIRVGNLSDLILARGEVVLTFDDGPIPGKTPSILNTLDRHGVKATFFTVGQMANAYPHLVRDVAARGHTIATHTQNHPNLASMSFESAVAEIDKGKRSVAAALGPNRSRIAPFFRFPYLASTAALRRHLAMQGTVVVDPTVDSKDYFVSTPDQVRARTIARLEAKGSGIVLFHDIHSRTASMLPQFLDDLNKRGFKVVHLVPRSRDAEALIVAAVSQ